MAKKFTDVLSEMIENDTKNNSDTMARCDTFVKGDLAKGGAHVTMGIPANLYMDFVKGNRTFILLAIDTKEYEKVLNS